MLSRARLSTEFPTVSVGIAHDEAVKTAVLRADCGRSSNLNENFPSPDFEVALVEESGRNPTSLRNEWLEIPWNTCFFMASMS
jgi:hypothetical protein